VKLMPGGLVEAEFVAQALQVAHGHAAPAILSPTTRQALVALGRAGLLDAAEVAALVAAEKLWRAVIAHLRLTVGRWREEALPEPVAAALLRAVAPLLPRAPVDQSDLRAQMHDVAQAVRGVFRRRVGAPES
jgi:glutamate-ammonia-ligase adenylyltransferase